MFKINKDILVQPIQKLQVRPVIKNEFLEIISISLEKDSIFPEHTSPKDANLLLLEGRIAFHISGQVFTISQHELFTFPKEEIHWVKAFEHSKFLIIR